MDAVEAYERLVQKGEEVYLRPGVTLDLVLVV